MENRVKCIDGWRAIAALGVLFTHTLAALQQPSLFIGSIDFFKILNLWGSGVHLFFVISGFCFFLVMTKEDNYSLNGAFAFWKKRWLRIAPAFYIACLVYGFFKYGNFSYEFARSLFANFIFLQTYIPGTEITGIFWSLSVEWIFYLLLPFIFILIKRIGYIWGIGLMLVAGIILNLLHYTGFIYPNNFAWYYTIFANFEHFGWGILLGLIYKRKLLIPSLLSGKPGFVLGLIVAYAGKLFFYSAFVKAAGKFGFLFESTGPLIMTLGFAMMILSTLRDKFLNKLLSNKVFVFIGRISYSFYLWHFLILEFCTQYFANYVPSGAAGVGVLGIITLVVLLPISYLSYKLLESFYFKLTDKSQGNIKLSNSMQ